MSRIEKLLELLETSKGDNFLQHAMALEYIKIGEDAKAEELFNNILTADPGYIGSYYHLAKLLERVKRPAEAVEVYKKGMQETQKAKDQHAYNELQAALEDLEDE